MPLGLGTTKINLMIVICSLKLNTDTHSSSVTLYSFISLSILINMRICVDRRELVNRFGLIGCVENIKPSQFSICDF